MTNAIVDVRFFLDLPESKLVELVKDIPPDDETWFEAACNAAEQYVADNLSDCLDRYATNEPDIECER